VLGGELLTTKHACGTLVVRIGELIIAHHRKSLISDATQIAALVKADVILLGRLHQLRLIHNLSDLLLEQAVWQDSRCICVSAIAAGNRGTFLRGVLLFSVTTLATGILFESSCLSFLAIRE
jgi:hypothetical protein